MKKMSLVRFISVPEGWTLRDIVFGLRTAVGWERRQMESIKLIHFERTSNNKKHVRISFASKTQLHQLIADCNKTKTENIFSLRINNMTVLMEVMNNAMERFAITDANRSRFTGKSSTVVINFFKNESFFDIINKLSSINSKKVNQISINFLKVFVKFYDLSDADSYAKSMSHSFYSIILHAII